MKDIAGTGTVGSQGLFQRWKKRTTNIPNIITTTIAPGSLSDLNLRMQSLQDQLTNLQNGFLLEEKQIEAMSLQIQAMSVALNSIYNAVITNSG